MTPQVSPPLSFGSLLKRSRRTAGLTQEALGGMAGYTAAYISALEHGERVPPPATAELLAGALKLEGSEHTTFLQAAAVALQTRRRVLEADGDEPVPPVGAFLGATPEGPLVARASEIGRLDAALTTVLEGSGRLIMLAGEPGIGKTRLAQEVALRARARGALVATGRCYEPLQAVAFAPFAEALGMVHTAAPATVRDELAARWPEVRRLLPDTTQPVAGPPAVSERDAQQRLFWQVTGFVQAVASARPVALLVDDVHWADEASLGLLLHLARHTRGARVLLVGTYRDVELSRHPTLQAMLHALRHERLLERVQVQGLEAAGMGALVAATLEVEGADGVTDGVTDGVVAEVLELLQHTTEGNPFFAQELLRMLIERGELARNAATGRWECRTAGELDVPETVRDAIGERVARLRPSTQEVLRAASVLGQVFTFAALCQMCAETHTQAGECEGPEERVRHREALTVKMEEALEEALQAGLLRETQELRDASHGFRHALTQRAVYAAIPALRRRGLHRAAGAALELLAQRGRGHQRPAAEAAQHFLEGDAVERALPYVLLAGDLAQTVYAHSEAERQYRLALDLAREVGDAEREAEAQQKLGALCDNLGRFDEAIAMLEQAARGYRALGDRERLARATHRLVRAMHRTGKITEGVGHLQALVVFLTSGDTDDPSERHPDLAGPRAARALDTLAPAAAALIGGNIANYLATLGRAKEALPAIAEAAAHARTAGDVQIQVFVTYMQGNILRDLGRLDDAEQAWHACSMLAREAGSLDFRAIALSNLGLAQVVHGDLAHARVLHMEALEVATQLGDPYLVAWSRGDLAELAFIGGDWGQARTELASALEAVRVRPPGASRAAGLTYGAGMPLALLGRLNLAEGRTDEGLLALGEVLRLSASSTASGILPWAQQVLAEHDLLAGEPEAARRRLEPVFGADGYRESALPATLAWALLELGARDRALQVVEATVAVARARRLRLALVEALPVLARVALSTGRLEDGAQAADEALALARSMPYPYAEAKALYVYGQLELAQGKPDHARARWEAARVVLHHLGEWQYAEQVEQLLSAADRTPLSSQSHQQASRSAFKP